MELRRLDLLALAAALLALVMTVAYLLIMAENSDTPAAWFVGILVLGAALAGYGANPAATRRRAALLVSGAILLAAGVLALLSIGLPIVVAGVLALAAGARIPTRGPTIQEDTGQA